MPSRAGREGQAERWSWHPLRFPKNAERHPPHQFSSQTNKLFAFSRSIHHISLTSWTSPYPPYDSLRLSVQIWKKQAQEENGYFATILNEYKNGFQNREQDILSNVIRALSSNLPPCCSVGTTRWQRTIFCFFSAQCFPSHTNQPPPGIPPFRLQRICTSLSRHLVLLGAQVNMNLARSIKQEHSDLKYFPYH